MELDLACEILIRWLKKLPKTVAFDSHRMQDVYSPNIGILKEMNETFLGKVGLHMRHAEKAVTDKYARQMGAKKTKNDHGAIKSSAHRRMLANDYADLHLSTFTAGREQSRL